MGPSHVLFCVPVSMEAPLITDAPPPAPADDSPLLPDPDPEGMSLEMEIERKAQAEEVLENERYTFGDAEVFGGEVQPDQTLADGGAGADLAAPLADGGAGAQVSGRAETEADKGPGGGAGSVNVAEGTVHDGFVPYQRWKCGRCGRETQDTLAPGPRCCAFPRRVRVPLAADGSAGAEEVHGEVHAVGFVAEAAPP